MIANVHSFKWFLKFQFSDINYTYKLPSVQILCFLFPGGNSSHNRVLLVLSRSTREEYSCLYRQELPKCYWTYFTGNKYLRSFQIFPKSFFFKGMHWGYCYLQDPWSGRQEKVRKFVMVSRNESQKGMLLTLSTYFIESFYSSLTVATPFAAMVHFPSFSETYWLQKVYQISCFGGKFLHICLYLYWVAELTLFLWFIYRICLYTPLASKWVFVVLNSLVIPLKKKL